MVTKSGPIKVVVTGASGKMAREVLAALCRDEGFDPAGAVSRNAREEYLSLPDGAGLIPYSTDLTAILTRVRPHVLVDFTNVDSSPTYVRTAVENGVAAVVGTSGLPKNRLEEIRALSEKLQVGVVVAPNFALGAVLTTAMARMAARFYDSVEIIEQHHDQKLDSPSGTAIATAEAMRESRGEPFVHPASERQTLEHARGAELHGVALHSVRLPGRVAHQEVIFGGPGETLTLRHDSVDRISFMPGVLLAVRKALELKRYVYGLEPLMLGDSA